MNEHPIYSHFQKKSDLGEGKDDVLPMQLIANTKIINNMFVKHPRYKFQYKAYGDDIPNYII